MIVTSRLTLRPPSLDSIPLVVQWLNDPKTMRYSEQRHRHHVANQQQVYVGMMTTPPNKYLEICDERSIIGTISANVDKHNDVANVGILIGERVEWGKGFGTEAWQAFCDHLLGNGIRKIEAGCMAINFGMINIFRKTGMHQEGTRAQHFLVGNDLVDEVQWCRF